MTAPRRTLAGVFTRRGRLRNRWAAALAEPDTELSLAHLRAVWPEFGRNPMAFSALWPSFLTAVLDDRLVRSLSPADLASLEETGLLMASQPLPRLSLRDACGPLVTAQDLRNEPQAASSLLARLYWSPGAMKEERATIARTLATRGAQGDQHLAVYTDHLKPLKNNTAEPAMLAVLTSCLTVGFDVPALRIQRAGELARNLRKARITFPGTDLAIGYSYLLIERKYAEAAARLERAYNTNPDATALAGLLSAWIRDCDDDRIAAMARRTGLPDSPTVAALFKLSATLAWLEEPAAEGPRPSTAEELAATGIASQAGEWLEFAIGRLHLLEGDARRAVDVLVPLAEAHPERPHWNYHAAWALQLVGDRSGVLKRFHAASGWEGRWTLGCLVLDSDPSSAELVVRELGENATRTGILAVRLAMAGHRKPPKLAWKPAAGSAEEALESLRTELGRRLAERKPLALEEPPVRSIFLHLPLADRMLWWGLVSLPADPAGGRALLEHAAHLLGYPRAALVLAVHHLEESRYGEANSLLDQFSWRRDPAMSVLRAWLKARAGDDDATTRLEHLAGKGDARAHYALGSVQLGRAAEARPERRELFTRQAAAEFRAALEDPARRVPADTAALAFCAEQLSTASGTTDGSRYWPELANWPGSRRPAWVGWILALAELADDPGVVGPGVGEHLVSLLEEAESANPAAAGNVASGLLSAALSTGNLKRANAFTVLIGRLAHAAPEIPGLHDLAKAASVRLRPSDRSVKLVEPEKASPAMLLVAAERALGRDNPAAASRYLRLRPSSAEPGDRTGLLVADILDGRVPEPGAFAEPAADVPARTALALRVAQAAALAETDPGKCVETLVPAIRDHDLTGVVDVRKSLPLLCADAGRRRRIPARLAEMVRELAEAGGQGVNPLLLARCAAVVGEQRLAATLWARALSKTEDVPETVREEYVRLIRHQAVLARRRGDELEAAQGLQLAARLSSGQVLVPGEDEIAELNLKFQYAARYLRSNARHLARGQWNKTKRGLEKAIAEGDEHQAFTLLTQMQSIVDSAKKGTGR
jgi:hypothetical protein